MTLEAGKVNRRFTETELSGWQDSTTLYLGGETPMGPVYLGYAYSCLLYTSDAADERSSGDFGGRRIIKKKKY